ncbi:MAG: valyl-tRNA synthetase, partial [Lysobacterales bacterium]
MSELPTKYNFKEIDAKWSKRWVDENVFNSQPDPKNKPYVITIPPPNVTGILHMGHALNTTLQDIIMRYKRMNGFTTSWMVGTDHAGIATQNVVEKKIAKEGTNRHEVGREEFLKKVWDWKEEHGSTIVRQLKALGASCDWPRERFTMDNEYSEAVKKTFIELYKKDLIYKGERIINWCPRCLTALSDEEAEHKEHQGTFTHIKYLFKDDPKKSVTVATTRPETMLGDTAVAVNPNDERYKDLIGKELVLPLVDRSIKIIADDFVDPEFGTGAVKVTPAHDPNDFEMGQRHDLEFINIMHPDGRINENGGSFENQDRFEARKNIVAAIKESGNFIKVEDHTHAVGHCYRCHTIVEPYLSKQWFVKMAPLAKPAIEAVTSGKIKFHPSRWEKTYMNWMDNIRDWCISRQIWWGHRIPIWYDAQDNVYCAHDETEAQAQATAKHGKSVELRQEDDVLDTWFSSWLWPFATYGWPEKTEDLKYFYPGDSLFTASEIIFFWVARMIMAGYEFMGDIPFKDVYIHGTVRDSQGRKMSKSLGNSIDPLDIIEEYGADALRFSLIINSGTDLYISKEKFEIGRNFANKIWNASRLVMMNTEGVTSNKTLQEVAKQDLDLPSKWIISSFYSTLEKVSEAIEVYKYSEAESVLYDFFWSKFCAWYLEIIKNRWDDPTTQELVLALLEETLKLMHPFLPFVTEEVWTHLKKDVNILSVQAWPIRDTSLIDISAEVAMGTITELISGIRNIRAEWNISPKNEIDCFLATTNSEDKSLLTDNETLIKALARIKTATIEDELSQTKSVASSVVGSIKCAVPLGDVIDVTKEKARLSKQIEGLVKQKIGIEKRLSNEGFVAKAPSEVI